MSALPLESSNGGGRFPGFDVTSQAGHWDETTRATVEARLGVPPSPRFFTEVEQVAASALFDQLLHQRSEPRVPVAQMVDARLAEKQTDGWHYETMPTDEVAWRESLAGLDADGIDMHGHTFADCTWDQQHAMLESIHHLAHDQWHGMVAAHLWGLWTRYACTAFYAHPWAWNEIGFDGPAYPRGYKNMGVDRLESFEVHDAHPEADILRTEEP